MMAHQASDQSAATIRQQGIKRAAQEELAQRLAKKLDSLHIGYHNGDKSRRKHRRSESNNSKTVNELMDVEDTKDRVFIHDLDEELAEIESDEERPIFLPDIEKHLSRIPRSVLINDDDKKRYENMQLVLYQLPPSPGIPEKEDYVRKAILEARERASQNQGLTIPEWPEKPNVLGRNLDPEHMEQKHLNDDRDDLDEMDTS